MEDIYMIQAQYWSCVKFWGEGIPEPYWVCGCSKGERESLTYGDMVILKTNQQIDDFHWQVFGMEPGEFEERLSTEYFSFEEQSSYTPIFVELDTTENPLELGAFVNDTCIGATSIFAEDTMVMISAHMEGISGEIYFQSYYGSNKSWSPPIRTYRVKEKNSVQHEKRTIHTKENKDYYLVSFKKKEEKEFKDNQPDLKLICSPNPNSGQCTIKYDLPEETRVRLIICDMYGCLLNCIQEGNMDAGVHKVVYNGKDAEGNMLSNGIYIVCMETGCGNGQVKMVVVGD